MTTAIHHNHTGNHHWWTLAAAGVAALAIGAGGYAAINAVDSSDPVQKSPAVVVEVPAPAPILVPDHSVSSPLVPRTEMTKPR